MEQFDNQQNLATKKALAKKILVGAIAADVLAMIYFGVVTYAENQEGETRVNALLALVYNTMGKIGGTVLFFGIGTALAIVYVIKMAALKKQS